MILQPARLLSALFNSRNGNFMGGDDQYNKPPLEYWTLCYIFSILALLSLGGFNGHFRWWAFPIIWVVMIPVLMIAYSSVRVLIVGIREIIRMRIDL
jgi:hypothetical protein